MELIKKSLMTTLLITGGLAICVLMLRFIGLKLQVALNYRFGNNSLSRWLLMPGTVIHELSHYLMVKLFGLQATEVRLFIPDINSETLGYVNYTYQPFSFWNKLGLTFVGIAPLFGISGLLIFIYDKLFKNNFHTIYNMIEKAINTSNINELFNTFKYIFNPFNYSFGKLIIFMIICIFLLSGFSLSTADLKTTLNGLLYFIIVLLFIVILAQLFPSFNILCIRFIFVTTFIVILLAAISLVMLFMLQLQL